MKWQQAANWGLIDDLRLWRTGPAPAWARGWPVRGLGPLPLLLAEPGENQATNNGARRLDCDVDRELKESLPLAGLAVVHEMSPLN
ncbi:hypothetical protein GCM10023086_67260 [Streptomyces venetus]|uniref:Uncharacterized protein n=1 Tax=Streptomyces venetus TaxID=1701086 RepID=A0ABP8H6V4_9ACTN